MNPSTFRPKTDILQSPSGFELWIDLPGVRSEDLTIRLKNNELTIYGKVQPPLFPALHSEYPTGDYQRTFIVSDTVSLDSIQTSLKDGVLRLRLPQSQTALPAEIIVH